MRCCRDPDILECGVPRLTVKGGVIRRSEEVEPMISFMDDDLVSPRAGYRLKHVRRTGFSTSISIKCAA
jgi:hypothetical protein